MAVLSFTIPDALLPGAIAAFCASYGYQANVPDPAHPGQMIPNPQTPAQFTQQCIVNYGKAVVVAYQAKVAAEAARVAAQTSTQSTLDAANITVTVA